MFGYKSSVIHERSNIIPIQQSLSTSITNATTYSLKQNCFDPTKCSPPNEFMKKLQERMNTYGKLDSLGGAKDSKLDRE